jgi:4-hydroxy-tetrahydrodipicolinate synthase
MIDLAQQGDVSGARAIDESLRGLLAALAVTTNPIPVKAALNLLGHDVGGLRLPLVQADAAQTQAVAQALEASGILARV